MFSPATMNSKEPDGARTLRACLAYHYFYRLHLRKQSRAVQMNCFSRSKHKQWHCLPWKEAFSVSFLHMTWLCLSDLGNLKFPMLGQSTFPESTSWHVEFLGYKASLHKAYLEMQYPSRSSGKHLSPMPQSYRGRKKGTDVELSWTQSSWSCSYQSEWEECKKVRDLFQPWSHSLYAAANAHKNFAVLLFNGCCFHGTEVVLVCTKATPLTVHKRQWRFLSISIIRLVFTNVPIYSYRPSPQKTSEKAAF